MLRKVPAREKKVASADLLVPAARAEQGRTELPGAGLRKMGAFSDPLGARVEKEGAAPGKELVRNAQGGARREQVRAPGGRLGVANAHLDGRGGQARGADSAHAAADSGHLRRTGEREPATRAHGSGPDIARRKPANAEEKASNAELPASNCKLRTGKCEVRTSKCEPARRSFIRRTRIWSRDARIPPPRSRGGSPIAILPPFPSASSALAPRIDTGRGRPSSLPSRRRGFLHRAQVFQS
jgi:hypothetical protein